MLFSADSGSQALPCAQPLVAVHFAVAVLVEDRREVHVRCPLLVKSSGAISAFMPLPNPKSLILWDRARGLTRQKYTGRISCLGLLQSCCRSAPKGAAAEQHPHKCLGLSSPVEATRKALCQALRGSPWG